MDDNNCLHETTVRVMGMLMSSENVMLSVQSIVSSRVSTPFCARDELELDSHRFLAAALSA
jgi:hypothetical protein